MHCPSCRRNFTWSCYLRWLWRTFALCRLAGRADQKYQRYCPLSKLGHHNNTWSSLSLRALHRGETIQGPMSCSELRNQILNHCGRYTNALLPLHYASLGLYCLQIDCCWCRHQRHTYFDSAQSCLFFSLYGWYIKRYHRSTPYFSWSCFPQCRYMAVIIAHLRFCLSQSQVTLCGSYRPKSQCSPQSGFP